MSKKPERAMRPRIFTIPPSHGFVDALAAGILRGAGADPFALARMRVLLPTRRACRSLRDAFFRASGGHATLLPNLTPIGDLDEDEIAISAIGDETGASDAPFDLPPPISGLRRQLLLTRLVLAFERRNASPDQAARLAAELARLLDQVQTERLSLADLGDLVPDRYAAHWQITLSFLRLLTERWPEILAEEDCLDPADRRNRVLEAQAERWRVETPEVPVIAAGSTGSIPATADLLGIVAQLPNGSVVLPGLDLDAGPEAWSALEPSHPQYGMARLLSRLGITRDEVAPWPELEGSAPYPPESRARLINLALRPAAATRDWLGESGAHADAVSGVTRIDCPGPQEEAGVVALVLRGALDVRGRTAALVTPDRDLARRVASELGRWGIEIDDSAGRPLAQTPPGSFLRLSARMVAERFQPVPLLAVLKHPIATLGRPAAELRALARRLERAALRGPRPRPGLAFLRRTTKGNAPELKALIGELERASGDFARALRRRSVPFTSLVRAHVEMAEALAASESGGSERLWRGEAGEAAAEFVAELIESASAVGAIPGASYPAFFDSLIAERVVRPRWGRHPRLAIWGLLEARLQHADVLVLGSLNEGTWPPEAHANPWMSRPMLADFGLPLPERRIGLAAHDFVQAFSAPEVYLTRAERVEGTPTVPSRWLLRLETLLRGSEAELALAAGKSWLPWQRHLDQPDTVAAAPRPAPAPPVAVRPRSLSVTQVETWMRDPYAIYARYVLGLRALEPLDADPGTAEYGNSIHRALDAFLRKGPELDADGALHALIEAGRRVFGPALERPGVWAFWWPRFERIAHWFLDFERQRTSDVRERRCEVEGTVVVAGPAGPFTLTARADRIDRLADGSLAIIDYKTGAIPKLGEVAAGFAPQLPLEAAIAHAGGFKGIARSDVSSLEFWRLTGREPAGVVTTAGDDPRVLAENALAGLTALIAVFDDSEIPYEARPRPAAAPRFGDYDHLARIKEWSAAGMDESE
ncbi:MAG: double-strand break repair protein AddB [Rhodospirillales bacterium]|jgi:ATP-dependent helicase/nuclease subunit B|nr:double-strand break repair protein AddB [Rhodospirillales bacterium]